MATLHTYKLSVKDIQPVGSTCTDITVSFGDLACGNVTCTKQPDENGILHVQIPEDCLGEEVEVLIECNEECTNCDPIRTTIEICADGTECDGCSDCDDHICVTKCKDNEFCDDGGCVECNSEVPCDDPNKECVNGECVCIHGLVENDLGQCVPCIKGEAPPCYECRDSGLKKKECPDGVCDEETDTCVDCLGSGDCDDPNAICKDKKCVCKEGFERDPVTGKCVEKPECETDKDCNKKCEECNQFGDCQPKVCDDGKVCDETDGECKKRCEDGTDCGDGEGCNPDTGFCEDCDDKDCSTPDCEKLLGCGCDGSDCVDEDNCSGKACNNPEDCEGENCTCDKGQCVSCKNFACEGCDKPGCRCSNGKDCLGDPNYTCQDTFDVVGEDENCNIKAEATAKDACSCDPVTLTLKPLTVNSEDDNFVNVDLVVDARKGIATTFNEANSLPRLDNTSHSDIADNDEPETGNVNLRQVIDIIELDDNGNPISGTQDTVEIFSLNLSFTDTSTVDTTNLGGVNLYKKGGDYEHNGVTHRITRVTFTAVQDDNFDFSNRSGCVYNRSNTIVNTTLSSSDINNIVDGKFGALKRYVTIYSEDERNPLIKWLRNDPSATIYNKQTDVFRKTYQSPDVNGVHRDVLYGPDAIPALTTTLSPSEGALWAGFGYAAEADCLCGDNYEDYGKANFCQIDGLNVEFNDCLTTFEIEYFEPCDVAQDLSQPDWNVPQNIQDQAQVVWDVYVNGVLHGTYQHEHSSGDVVNVNDNNEEMFQIFTLSEAVNSMRIVQRTQLATSLCELEVDVPTNAVDSREVDYTVDCDRGDEYEVTVQIDQTPVDIERIKGWPEKSGGVIKESFTKGDSETAVVVFVDGCEKTITIDPDCCDERTVSALSTTLGPGGGDMIVEVSGMQHLVNYTLVPPTGTPLTGTLSGGKTSTIHIPEGYPGGSYVLTVQDSNIDCEALDSIEVTVQGALEPEIEITSDNPDPQNFSFCSGGDEVSLNLQINSDGIGGSLKYTRTEVGNPGSTVNLSLQLDSNNKSISNISQEYIYSFDSIEKNGEIYSVNKEVTTVEVEEPQVDSITASTNALCLGDSVEITLEGTPNTTAQVSGGVGAVAIDSEGVGVVSVTPSSEGTKTYSVTSTSSGPCGSKNVTGLSTTVVVSQPATIQGSSECVNSNPDSQKKLTFQIDQEGGSVEAVDYDNPSTSFNVNGGGNGDGTSTFTVLVAHDSPTDTVEFTFTNSDGCAVTILQAVPASCNCPNGSGDITVNDVCVNSGDDMTFEIHSVTFEGIQYGQGEFDVSWTLNGAEQSTNNPYVVDTSGFPVGSVQRGYTVTVNTGTHNGCTLSGFASGQVTALPEIDVTPTQEYENFSGTLCDGGSVDLVSSLEGDSYAWSVNGGSTVGTDREFTFNESASPLPHTVEVEVTTSEGCVVTASMEILVEDCSCNVQYIDINTDEPQWTLYASDGRAEPIFENAAPFSGGTPSNVQNDALKTELNNALVRLGDTVGPGDTELYWQYLDHVGTSVRFYVLGSNIELDRLTTENSSVDFTKDCDGNTVPGCDDNTKDNYNADLNSNGHTYAVTDDGSCFDEPELIACHEVIVDGDSGDFIKLSFNATAGDFEIVSEELLANISEDRGDIAVSQTHGLFATQNTSFKYVDVNIPSSTHIETIESSVNGVFLDNDTFLFSTTNGERFFTIDLTGFDPNNPSAPAPVEVIDFNTHSGEVAVQAMLDIGPAGTPGDIIQIGSHIYFNKALNLFRFEVDASNNYVANSFEDLGKLPFDARAMANLKGKLMIGGGSSSSHNSGLWAFTGTMGTGMNLLNNYTQITNPNGTQWDYSSGVTIHGAASLEDSGVSC